MSNRAYLEDFVDKLSACESMDEAWDVYNEALEAYGVEHACYGFMATLPRRAVTTEVLTWSSHATQFTDAYMTGNHPDNDWSVHWAMTRTEPQRWRAPEVLDGLSEQEQRTEELAYDFGLYEGIVIPIRGATPLSWGGIGLAAPNLDPAEWGRLLACHQRELETVSQAFHEYVLAHGYLGHFELSEREREVVKWIACGLNKHDIADKLNISARTAEVHIYRIRRKLDCMNDAQVTAKALVFNLIST